MKAVYDSIEIIIRATKCIIQLWRLFPNIFVDRFIKIFMISDGALAQRLQSEEINTHLHGNRQRNHQIREDVPRARQEQVSEVEEACKQGLN